MTSRIWNHASVLVVLLALCATTGCDASIADRSLGYLRDGRLYLALPDGEQAVLFVSDAATFTWHDGDLYWVGAEFQRVTSEPKDSATGERVIDYEVDLHLTKVLALERPPQLQADVLLPASKVPADVKSALIQHLRAETAEEASDESEEQAWTAPHQLDLCADQDGTRLLLLDGENILAAYDVRQMQVVAEPIEPGAVAPAEAPPLEGLTLSGGVLVPEGADEKIHDHVLKAMISK